MSSVWIILAIVSVVILQKLFSVLGKDTTMEKFRGVVPGTGQVFEMTLSKIKEEGKKELTSFDEQEFLFGAKIAFNTIVDAFSKGNKAVLKPILSKKVYEAFCAEIDKRQENEQKMEFFLIAINSSKILTKNDEKKPTSITVELITEQMNVLRDKDGIVLEGDAVQIAKVKDVWTFKKESKLHSGWIVCATKSEAV